MSLFQTISSRDPVRVEQKSKPTDPNVSPLRHL